MTRDNPRQADKEFHDALSTLLHEYYSGRAKALALDLEVAESTVSRWMSNQCGPSDEARVKVLSALNTKKEEHRTMWERRLHWILEKATPDQRRAIVDIVQGKRLDNISSGLLSEIMDLIIAAYKEIT